MYYVCSRMHAPTHTHVRACTCMRINKWTGSDKYGKDEILDGSDQKKNESLNVRRNKTFPPVDSRTIDFSRVYICLMYITRWKRFVTALCPLQTTAKLSTPRLSSRVELFTDMTSLMTQRKTAILPRPDMSCVKTSRGCCVVCYDILLVLRVI